MTAALDAIRARHRRLNDRQECADDEQGWPCDVAILLAALDRAEAVVVAARKVKLDWADLNRPTDLVPLLAALDAYEDADKVADG